MIITYEEGTGLYVNMTNACSNSCDFCVRGSDALPYGNLWLERDPTASEVLSDIFARDLSAYSELVFCGFGEPTYRIKEIAEIAKKVREKSDIPFRINTNGQSDLINDENTAPLFACFDTVSISLNAKSAKEYDEKCHSVFGLSAFDALITFAKNVRAYAKNVVFSVVEGTLSRQDIEACRRIAESCGVTLRVRAYIQ